MKTRCTILILTVASFFATVTTVTAQSKKSSSCDLKSDMRKLWEEHISWTRNVIFNILDNLPGTNQAVTRLLQNQDDIGNAIKPIYGATAGNTLAGLLHGHITTAADILVALKNNDSAGVANANAAWYANGDSIVDFLASLNPFWPRADLDMMMESHLDLTENEALARYHHDYDMDVKVYDSVHVEILAMADFLTNGIVSQFPNLFYKEKGMRMEQSVELSNNTVLLGQNAPNPFSESTVISYFVPDYVNETQIQFMDNNGNVIKTVAVQQKGDGILNVFAPNLSKGIYTYSIIADGKVIETKRMVH